MKFREISARCFVINRYCKSLSWSVQEVKLELGNEEIDRGAKDFAITSFRISIQMTSIVNDGYSRQFYVSLLDMLQTYLEIQRATTFHPFTTDSGHGF